MHVDDQPEGLEFVAQPIQVNVGAIEDFAALLAMELDTNFRPSGDRVIRQHADGVGFGSRHASIDMRLAVIRYFECLSASVDNVRQFVAASEVLIEVAQKIAAIYQSADEDAQALQKRLASAIADSVDEANAARQGAIDEIRRAAMHRRLARFDQDQQT